MNRVHVKKTLAAFTVFLGDIAGIIASLNIAHYLWLGEWHEQYAITPETIALAVVLVTVQFLFNTYSYSKELAFSPSLRFLAAHAVSLLMAMVVLFVAFRYQGGLLGRGPMMLTLGLFFIPGFLMRRVFLQKFGKAVLSGTYLYITSFHASKQFMADLEKSKPRATLDILYDPAVRAKAIIESLDKNPQVKEIAPWTEIDTFLTKKYDAVLLGLRQSYPPDLLKKLMPGRLKGLPVYDLNDYYEINFHKVPVFHLKEGWFVFAHGFSLLHNEMALRIKRIADILFSLLLLVPGLPIMIVTGIIVRLTSPGPAIYKQKRVGLNDQEFTLYKFRSMRQDAEKHGAQWAAKNDDRVTPFGKFIRLVRLDELPQLFNVLKGNMSFIGPRPERKVFSDELDKEIPFYSLRHLVKPGITGWAQVNYPYGASVEDARQKLEYDLYYIKNYSVWLDVLIVLRTIRVILWGKGR